MEVLCPKKRDYVNGQATDDYNCEIYEYFDAQECRSTGFKVSPTYGDGAYSITTNENGDSVTFFIDLISGSIESVRAALVHPVSPDLKTADLEPDSGENGLKAEPKNPEPIDIQPKK